MEKDVYMCSYLFREDLQLLTKTDATVQQFLAELQETVKDQDFPSEKELREDIIEFSAPELVGYGVGFSFIAYFLFRWAKDRFDYRRAVSETSIAERRIALIKTLANDGWPQELAEAIVTRCLDAISKRSEDDPVLNQVLAAARNYLLKSGEKNQEPG